MATANKCDILTPRDNLGQFSRLENSTGTAAVNRYKAEKEAKVARTEKGRAALARTRAIEARHGKLIKRS